jgi:hypothetical protein
MAQVGIEEINMGEIKFGASKHTIHPLDDLCITILLWKTFLPGCR